MNYDLIGWAYILSIQESIIFITVFILNNYGAFNYLIINSGIARFVTLIILTVSKRSIS